MASVEVKAPSTRTGFLVQRRLLYGLSAEGKAVASQDYVLDIAINQWEEDVLLQQDADVSRRNVVVEAYYTLADAGTGQYLYRSNNRAVAGYNRFDSDFANIAAAQSAEMRAAETVADSIATRLALYFSKSEEDTS
ncbi:MAG: LPS assembly lipoprotein LptE [Parvularculales bacterium]